MEIISEPNINEHISAPQVRLIGPQGEQVGVVATNVALNLARDANLDLVEVAPNAKPPVAKLIDYGKFKYTEKIKQREARRNQTRVSVKEIRFRLKIDDHDFLTKEGHVRRFLESGDKVKVTIMLRGRERYRPVGGKELLLRLAQDIEDVGTVESVPHQEGRDIFMVLAPKGKKVQTQSEQRRRGQQARAERQARQIARLKAAQEEKLQEKNQNQINTKDFMGDFSEETSSVSAEDVPVNEKLASSMTQGVKEISPSAMSRMSKITPAQTVKKSTVAAKATSKSTGKSSESKSSEKKEKSSEDKEASLATKETVDTTKSSTGAKSTSKSSKEKADSKVSEKDEKSEKKATSTSKKAASSK